MCIEPNPVISIKCTWIRSIQKLKTSVVFRTQPASLSQQMTNLPPKIAQMLSNQNSGPPNSSGYTMDMQIPEYPMRLSIMAQSDAHLWPHLSRIRPAGSPIQNPRFAKEIASSTEIKPC